MQARREPASGSRFRAGETMTTEWGPPPLVASRELRQSISDLQVDLQGMVDDMGWGPLHRISADGKSFLGDLRMAFLRHHRRLLVHVRAEGGTEFAARVRTELAELAEAFRVHALSRASRASHESWSPAELADAIDRALQARPVSLRVPMEPTIYQARDGDGFSELMQRSLLGADAWIRRISGDEGQKRDVEVRSFLSWHIRSGVIEGLEGLAVLLVQAESHLEARARNLFELVVASFEALVAEPDELVENLNALRRQVEEELQLAEQEHGRFLADVEARARRLLARATRAAKAELADIGTFRVPNRARNGARLLPEVQQVLNDLNERLTATREVASGGYVMLGLRLELARFRARVNQRLESEILDLERGVRGRSYKQIERTRAALDVALEAMGQSEAQAPAAPHSGGSEPSQPASPASEAGGFDAEALAQLLEDLRRVLRDAQRAAQQLVDQLTSEQALADPIEAVTREASQLTDFYRVPVQRLIATEWTLPEPAEVIELPFAKVVGAFIETDVAPQLLDIAAKASSNLQPMLAAFAEVERVVNLGGGQLDGDDALVRDVPELGETRSVLEAAFVGARDQLKALEKPAESWSKELARSLRGSARQRLDALEARLGEGGIEATAQAARQSREPGAQRWKSELVRLGMSLAGLGSRSRRKVRAAVGEDRLADVRRVLGLPSRGVRLDLDQTFEPPQEQTPIPPFYRRLFAGQATWAGDVLEERQGAISIARALLSTPEDGRLRAAAVVGLEGSGRRALLGALTRGDRFGPVRRVAFLEPVTVDEVEAIFAELGQGQLVVLTGFSWLVSAGPRGFEALRSFTDGVLADAGRNAFLIEADRLVWDWSCAVAPLADVFADPIEVPQLEPQALERALLARHRLSGLGLSLDAFEGEDAARQRLFLNLHRASDGLLQIALAYWLAALEVVDESGGRVRVGAVPPSPHEAVRALPVDTLHVLYLVARQGWMTSEILADVLGRRPNEGAATLARLTRRGLLERGPADVYLIRRHLGGAVQSVLTERGWTA